jgi:hypothetical protein
MGLIDAIARSAARNAHVLVIEAPGSWQTRAAAERAALARGWRLAFSPADADVLAICGHVGPQLAQAVEQLWQQMPGPRVRVDLPSTGDAAHLLDEAHASLLDTARHGDDARSRPTAPPEINAASKADDHGDMGHGDMGHGDMGHGDMGHGDMGHGDMGHGDMGHGDMDMSPAGIPLAEGGEDRDGLEMDVLHLRLGPVLPYWPAGLLLRCDLQGDVITHAEAHLLDEVTDVVVHGHAPAVQARRTDNLVSLLALAGWDDAAAQARVVRNLLLEDRQEAAASVAAARLVRRVRRSRVLRWSLRGIAPLSAADLLGSGLPPSLEGDTYDRLVRMLDGVLVADGGASLAVHQLPQLVTGLDLAAARLVIASLDLHELHIDETQREASHG